MRRLIGRELRRALLSAPVWAVALAVGTALVVLSLLPVNVAFDSPYRVFAYTIGSSGIVLAYPVAAVAISLIGFGQELARRWAVLTRTRVSLRRYLAAKAVANAVSAFTVFFVVTFLVAAVILLIEPTLGWRTYETFPGDEVTAPAASSRLSQLIATSTALYALAYAAWSGLNAAVWASVGFGFLLVVRNRFVALSAPTLLVIVATLGMSVAGGAFFQSSPWEIWTLVDVGQVSMVPMLVAMGGYLIVSTAFCAGAIRRSDRLGAFQ
ncbi:MAG: hypothetical protein QM635_05305 [Microbacteriaceae bacterium]